MKWIIFLIVLGLIAGAIVYFETKNVQPTNNGVPTRLIPAISSSTIPTQNQFPTAPELAGITGYLNTNNVPITIGSLRGKVVLIDFWTYTCINCIRTLPYLVAWDNMYRDKGL